LAKKRRRRRPSLLTKGINVGILAIAFSGVLRRLFTQGFSTAALQRIAADATGDLSIGGKFNQQVALQFYGPMLGAIVLKKVISMVRRTARV